MSIDEYGHKVVPILLQTKFGEQSIFTGDKKVVFTVKPSDNSTSQILAFRYTTEECDYI